MWFKTLNKCMAETMYKKMETSNSISSQKRPEWSGLESSKYEFFQ